MQPSCLYLLITGVGHLESGRLFYYSCDGSTGASRTCVSSCQAALTSCPESRPSHFLSPAWDSGSHPTHLRSPTGRWYWWRFHHLPARTTSARELCNPGKNLQGAAEEAIAAGPFPSPAKNYLWPRGSPSRQAGLPVCQMFHRRSPIPTHLQELMKMRIDRCS